MRDPAAVRCWTCTYIQIVVDGCAAYNAFKVRQRCWAHVLRDAELLVVVHGTSLEELHWRLQSIFHSAKSLPRDISVEDLQKWIDNVSHIAGAYTELGYKFGGKLFGAAPDLFTFVRHPGMGPPATGASASSSRSRSARRCD